MGQTMDFATITACSICNEFPCGQLTSIIHWNPNIVEHSNALAKKYREQED